jgi:regulator of RNase E activity RraA
MIDSVERDYDEYAALGRIWGQVPRERIRKIRFSRIAKDVVRQFLELDDLTTSVSDVLDSLGVRGAIAGSHIPSLIPGKRIAGTVVTLRSIPERITPTQGHITKDTIKMSTREIYYLSEPGDVLVCDFGGNLDVSNMGGQSCLVGKTHQFSGAIINGAVRDVSAIRALDYPVWCRGVTPITGKFRMEAVEINGPVTVHDVVTCPGDLVVADDSGICFVPSDLVGHVLEKTKSICEEERQMSQLIMEGRSIGELKPLFRRRYE